jgi:molecular chaperone IbpA
MSSIDLTPLYRSSIGYDRLGSLIDSALRGSDHATGYPPYNIEVLDENHYAITLALAGFDKSELDLNVENNVLTIRGQKAKEDEERNYLHLGIANRAFERKFNLAEHVEVTSADLNNGLLTVNLLREIPEAMKPRSIAINQSGTVLEHKQQSKVKGSQAA